MKWKWTAVLGLILLAGMTFAQDKGKNKSKNANTATDQNSMMKTVSYGYGFNQGKQLLSRGIELDPESMVQGFKDAFAKKKALYSNKELEEAYAAFDKIITAKKAEQAKAVGKIGEDFLAAKSWGLEI